jgi:hypothetical protein
MLYVADVGAPPSASDARTLTGAPASMHNATHSPDPCDGWPYDSSAVTIDDVMPYRSPSDTLTVATVHSPVTMLGQSASIRLAAPGCRKQPLVRSL